MKLTCPACNAAITADQINIHDQVAVCGACHTVFRFAVPERKRKQRKVKQPPRLTVSDPPGELVMQYRRIFNEEERGMAWGNGFFALIVLPLLLVLTLIYAPVWMFGLISVWLVISWYVQAALFFNQTTISLDDEQLAIMQKPLPTFSGARNFTLNSAEIVEAFCDETEESRRAASVNRFYHVRLRQTNGDVITILKALPGEVALFIAQEINAGPDNAAAFIDEDDSDALEVTDTTAAMLGELAELADSSAAEQHGA
ncbi:MAG: hypothetical protein JXA10_00495 [Anaerolineae bacterium]|nr:hypothetical protein [Anaerolineae bacterium]